MISSYTSHLSDRGFCVEAASLESRQSPPLTAVRFNWLSCKLFSHWDSGEVVLKTLHWIIMTSKSQQNQMCRFFLIIDYEITQEVVLTPT